MRRFIFFAAFFSTLAFGQNLQNAQLIEDFLGTERYQTLLSQNSGYLYFLDARISVGYAIYEMPTQKTVGFPVLENIPYKNTAVNPTEKYLYISASDFLQLHLTGNLFFPLYDIPYDQNKSVHYRLGNTGMILEVRPASYISQIANERRTAN